MESIYNNSFNYCKFKDYAPHVFRSIWKEFGISNESYINSIGLKTFQNAFFDKLYLMLSENSTGKSGSFFFHTSDGKYMIKTIKEDEFKVLLNQLPGYHDYLCSHP